MKSVEQLGWRLPRHTVVPMAIRLVADKNPERLPGICQARARRGKRDRHPRCAGDGLFADSAAQKAGLDIFRPVKPDTIAKSLAIGTPADGYYAIKVMKDTGGSGGGLTDEKSARHQAAGGDGGHLCRDGGRRHRGRGEETHRVGKIPRNDSAVLCITGNGLKTQEAVAGKSGKPCEIKPSLREFEALLAHEEKVNV